MDRSILITGCSSGIGYDAAHGLKARGWRVFATCRNEVDCENLRKEGLESFRLDYDCLLYTSPSPRDRTRSRMPSSA